MPQFTCPSVRFDLGEQAEMIRDTVAGFAPREIAPLAEEIDRSNTVPAPALAQARRARPARA